MRAWDSASIPRSPPRPAPPHPPRLRARWCRPLRKRSWTLIVGNLITPGLPVSFGIWPFVSDLRTGSFTGGGGEEALLTAAAVQMCRFYDLPSSVGAGMTDAKAIDAQAGL